MNIEQIVKANLKKVIKESEDHITGKGTYMVLQNLQQMMDNIETILKYKHHPMFPKLVTGDHAWAGDHITTSKDDIEEVSNFIKLQIEGGKNSDIDELWVRDEDPVGYYDEFDDDDDDEKKPKPNKPKNSKYGEIDESKNCPTDPAKWAASKAAAKAKFDVYPSAYANGWAAKNYKAKGGGWKKCK